MIAHIHSCVQWHSFAVHCHTSGLLTVLEGAIAGCSDSWQWSDRIEKVFDNHVTIPDPDVIPLWNFSYQYTSLNNLWDKPFRLKFPSLFVVFIGMW